MLLVDLSYILSTCLLGLIDAILYGRKGAESFKWNEHIPLVILRTLIAGGPAYGFFLGRHTDLHDSAFIFCILFYVCQFSFFHNGVYEVTKALINKNYKSFIYHFINLSSTDTAIFKFDFTSRACILAFGLLIAGIGFIVVRNISFYIG